MAAAGCDIGEPRRLRLLGTDLVKPVDRLVGQVVLEVVLLAVLGLRDPDDLLVLRDQGVVLPGLTTEEAPEVVESEPRRPAVERPGEPLLVVGGEMPLPEASRQVAVLLEDAREERTVARNGRVVSGERAGELADHAEAHPVVVAAGQQRCPGRRAERRDVEPVVAQPVLREPRVVRGLDRTAEGARIPEASVVDEDQEDVRRSFRGLDVHGLIPVGQGALESLLRLTAEPWAPNRENRPIDRRLAHHSIPSRAVARIGLGKCPCITRILSTAPTRLSQAAGESP